MASLNVFQLMIVPGIITAIFAVLIIYLVGRGVAAWVRASNATKAAANAHMALVKAYTDAYSSMEDALAGVIAELDSRPATYSTFPRDLGESLTAAYAKGRAAERQIR